jgi:predicted nuclease of restriction endonuclease-like (RecB) superfamily
MANLENMIAENIYTKAAALINHARISVLQSVNQTMVYTYYGIGKMIVEEEQGGSARAGYGKQIIKELSARLSADFGKGFSQRNLEQMRQFFQIYSKAQTVSAEFKLSWSHYLMLMRIDNEQERRFYEIESLENGWSLRELQRQFNTSLYERLVLSRDKNEVKKLAQVGQVLEKAKDSLKDPYILEFIGLQEESKYSETEFEQKIIDKLEHFLLELGNNSSFKIHQKSASYLADIQ